MLEFLGVVDPQLLAHVLRIDLGHLGIHVGALLEAHFAGEPLRTVPHEKDVDQLLHDAAGDRDRMVVARHRAHGAHVAGAPVHDEGVQLGIAEDVGIAVEADAAVGAVHLDLPDADLDGVHRGLAIFQRGHRLPDAHVAVVRSHDDHRVVLALRVQGLNSSAL